MIPGSGHADDRHRVAVEQNLLIQNGGIAVETRDPEIVGEDGDRVGAGQAVVIGSESAAQRCGESQSVEPGAGHQFRANAFAAIVVAEIQRGGETRGHSFEDGVVIAKVLVHRIGEAVWAPHISGLRTGAGEVHQLARVLDG